MLHLILYELQKLWGLRYLRILLLVMLVLCAALFYYSSKETANVRGEDKIYTDPLIAEFIERYESAPELRELHEAYEAWVEYKHAINMGASLDELLPVPEYVDSLGYTYENGDPIPDGEFFIALSELLRYFNTEYPDVIDGILSSTQSKMDLYVSRGAANTPAYEHQKLTHQKYAALKEEVKLSLNYVYGWGEFFRYEEIAIFIFAYIVLAAGIIFLHERTSGFLPVLRTVKNGGGKTTIAKMTAVFITAVFVVIMFTAVTFITCGAMFGFSSPNVFVQHGYAYTYCPYPFTMAGYAVSITLLRAVTAVMLATLLAAVSAATYSYAATYITGILTVGASLISYYFMTSSRWLYLNPMSVASSDKILNTYNTVIIFGKCVNVVWAAVALYGLLFAAAVAAAILMTKYHRGVVAVGSGSRMKTAIAKLRTRLYVNDRSVRRELRAPRMNSLFVWEMRKLMPLGIVSAAVILFFVSMYTHYDEYDFIVSDEDAAYASMVGEIFGEINDEKRDYILRELGKANEIVWDFSDVEEGYLNGSVGIDEYITLAEEAHEADSRAKLMSLANAKMRYLNSLERETSVAGEGVNDRNLSPLFYVTVIEKLPYLDLPEQGKGVKGWFFDEVNIKRLLSTDFDVYLLFVFIIIFTQLYAVEYMGKSSEGNFAALMQSTKRGRGEVWRAKVMATVITALGLCVVFFGVTFALGAVRVDNFDKIMSAPMMSIESYRALNSDITIGEFLALSYAFRFAGYILLALLCGGVSLWVKKQSSAMFVITLAALVPYALVYMGLLFLRYIDVTVLLAGGKLIMRSAELSTGSTWSFAVIFIVIYTAVTATALVCERRSIGK